MYKFPTITTIDDVLPSIEGRKEFVVADKGWFTVICYVVQTPDLFPSVKTKEDAIRRECRGIIFDSDGKILSRPFQKFFNVGEREETLLSNFDVSKKHWVLQKLDGSMVRPIFNKTYNGFRLGTKMGISETAMAAEKFVSENPHYFEYFRWAHENYLTPIFEWIGPDNRIVLKYDVNSLVLLAVRHTITGDYMDHDEAFEMAKSFGVPTVEDFEPIRDMAGFIEDTRPLIGFEGYVVRWENGYSVKIKAEDYLLKHKSKEIMESDRKVYALILDGKIDDIKPLLVEEDLKKISLLEGNLTIALTDVVDRLEKLWDYAKGMSRKEFALSDLTSSSFERAAIFHMFNGGNLFGYVKGHFLKNTKDNTSFDNLKKSLKINL